MSPCSSDIRTVGLEDEDDGAPIFSLSRSSMDVVMAAGPPHKRDPAWTMMDMRRSSSTNTHPENHLVALKQLPPHMWQHVNTTNSHHAPLTAPNPDLSGSPVLSERWIANVHRWSQCSSGTHSRSSTPDTIVGRDGTWQPPALPQETLASAAPDFQASKPMSPSTKPSFPWQTANLPPEGSSTSLSGHQKDFFSPTSSPFLPNSPNLLQRISREDDSFLDNNPECFNFPSPILSSTSLADGVSLVDEATVELHCPEKGNTLENLSNLMLDSANQKERLPSTNYLELPLEPGQRGSRSALVGSVSDSQLGRCCRCNATARESLNKAPRREEGTMTSWPELVDVEVQTVTPSGSLWGLRRDMSNSNMGSHSILGSPPGSKLNLKSSAGSNSNLVSPSSSMFPISSEDEEEKHKDDQEEEDTSHNPDRRRSCLKNQGEERDDVRRRSSMKQVQWDEEGMTWDIHGASPDPEDLNSAIQKHLELSSNQPKRRASTKKRAPKPPVEASVVRSPQPKQPGDDVERQDQETRKTDKGGGAKREEAAEADHRSSRAESDARTEEEGGVPPKSPSQGSAQTRKRSVIRALRRPGWCGGSGKIHD